MTEHAEGTLEVKKWDESPYYEVDERAKLTRASVEYAVHGDIEGESSVEYLMGYADAKTASYVGLQRVDGKVGRRSGSFVLQVSGKFESGEAEGRWFVVPGLGTGELRGLRGEGGFGPHGEGAMPYTLDYRFEGEKE